MPESPVPAVNVIARLDVTRAPAVVMSPLTPPMRKVIGSSNVSALMVISAVLSERPMVIDENPLVSAAISFASRSKVPVAESPIPMVVDPVAGCNVMVPVPVMLFAVVLLWGVWAVRTAYVGWAEHRITERQFLAVVVRFVAMYLVLAFFLLS